LFCITTMNCDLKIWLNTSASPVHTYGIDEMFNILGLFFNDESAYETRSLQEPMFIIQQSIMTFSFWQDGVILNSLSQHYRCFNSTWFSCSCFQLWRTELL